MGVFNWGSAQAWAFTLCFLFASSASALTRSPAVRTGEPSLLYWRYLCRGQPQYEKTVSGRQRELSCPHQRWKVRTELNQDQVIEVVEDAQ